MHWNARGVFKKHAELTEFLYRRHIDIACVQETMLGPKRSFAPKGFSVERLDGPKAGLWGLLTAVKNGINFIRHPVPDGVQAVPLEVVRPGASPLNVINFYSSPSQALPVAFLKNIVQLSNLMLLGDFNAHHPAWGYKHENDSGDAFCKLIDDTDLVMLNVKIPTHVTYTGETGVLDLSILSTVLALHAKYERLSEPMHSDHYPVIIDFDVPSPAPSTGVPQWKYKRANWSLYQLEIEKRCDHNTFVVNDIDSTYRNIKKLIYEAANVAIPKTKGKPRPRRLIYWKDDIKNAIRERRKAFKAWKRLRSLAAWDFYKRAKTVAQRVIRTQATAHWRGFCEGLDPSRPAQANKVWRTMASMQGDSTIRAIPFLLVNGQHLVSSLDKANAFGAHFAAVSGDAGYEEPLASLKKFMDCAMRPLFNKNEKLGAADIFNSPLTYNELKIALASVRTNTSPGPDHIPYILLKNLSPSDLSILLRFYNSIWTEGHYPKMWRVSLVIPMLKQGKDRSDLNSYRPIALSNCISKLLEKIVNKRLVWYLEHKIILSKAQSGFRRGMSTEDHIAFLQDMINKVLAVRQHLVVIFIDFTKAFDRVWRTGLFIRLRAIGICGNMFRYIRNIFKRTFLRVRLDGILSGFYEILNGILEGSVISPTLFILLIDAINSFIHDINVKKLTSLNIVLRTI
jgi:hypothetical protein